MATKAPRTTVHTPPLTKAEALSTDIFHENRAMNADGTCRRWYRNGQTQTWKSPTRANQFRIPVKHGLRTYGHITHHDAWHVHTEDNCPYRSR